MTGQRQIFPDLGQEGLTQADVRTAIAAGGATTTKGPLRLRLGRRFGLVQSWHRSTAPPAAPNAGRNVTPKGNPLWAEHPMEIKTGA